MVTLTNITMTGVVVTWTIPSFLGMEEYTVEYGKSTAALDLVSTPVQSIEDTTTNFEHYSIALQELSAGTQYYLRVVARFGTGDIYVRSSDIFSFFTQFERKHFIVCNKLVNKSNYYIIIMYKQKQNSTVCSYILFGTT